MTASCASTSSPGTRARAPGAAAHDVDEERRDHDALHEADEGARRAVEHRKAHAVEGAPEEVTAVHVFVAGV